MSRVLGLDYGSARCGCALSDPTETIVTPIEAIPKPAGRRGLAEIEDLIRERQIERVVIGLPVSLHGGDSHQTVETRDFARRLSMRLGEKIPVELHDERFTTKIARQDIGSHRAGEDSRAAAHMLESWLHARQRQRRPGASSA
ncbi:MAG TPA: Holliday junction resolvase RuvX [Solirubrobacteraceae bacterium]|nr:Holliday junction resolvase RuvX [Solirubrobacteraceae bacterium]